MATPTFFHADLKHGDTDVELTASEAAHARKSRRLKVGDTVLLLNGTGLIANCTIIDSQRHKVFLRVGEIQQQPANQPALIAAVAVPKGDRQRTMVDMLTQLGVTKIIALDCEYSATSARPKLLQKWQRVAIEACKQSQNPWLPEIGDSFTVPDLVNWLAKESECFTVFADLSGCQIIEIPSSAKKVLVLIGPEGGFSDQEVSLFKAAGFSPVMLTKNILRTETAAVVAISRLQN